MTNLSLNLILHLYTHNTISKSIIGESEVQFGDNEIEFLLSPNGI